MQTAIPSNMSNKSSSKIGSVSNHHGRKITGFYAKFLEFLKRKTEADKRVEVFGRDPFK